jgi:hypothetical protein
MNLKRGLHRLHYHHNRPIPSPSILPSPPKQSESKLSLLLSRSRKPIRSSTLISHVLLTVAQ